MSRQTLAERAALACNPTISAEIAAPLAADKDWCIRATLSRNPALPAEIAAALATDEDWEVRAALSRNPALPAGLLPALAADKDWRVRHARSWLRDRTWLRTSYVPAIAANIPRIRAGSCIGCMPGSMHEARPPFRFSGTAGAGREPRQSAPRTASRAAA